MQMQRPQHQSDAGQDHTAFEHAVCGQEIDRRCGTANNDQRRLGGQQLACTDQRRPTVAAELRGVAIPIDDAELVLLRNDPVRRRSVGPDLEHPDDGRTHACTGNVGYDDLGGRPEFRELRGKRRYFLQQRVARFQAILARDTAGAVAKQAPLQKSVADIDQQVKL